MKPINTFSLFLSTVSDPSQLWMLQHGRSVTLAVAINEAPERLLDQDGRPDLLDPLVKTFTNDRVSAE